MLNITFTVYGTPIPQGSMKAFTPKGWNRPILTSDNKRTKPWRQEIAGTVREVMDRLKLEYIPKNAGVRVECCFYFLKPKSTKKSVTHKTTKPDIDKLGRAVLDSLTGIVFVDDSQVTQLGLMKDFGDRERVDIRIQELEP